jgi:hypothetical protein
MNWPSRQIGREGRTGGESRDSESTNKQSLHEAILFWEDIEGFS